MARRKTDDHAVIAAPFGRVRIRMRADAVVGVDMIASGRRLRKPVTAFGRRVCRQFQRYFSDARLSIDVPLVAGGSAFQERVWRALRRIPVGQSVSYGELARRLKSSARAIGGACRRNPVPIVVPCHRVVSVSGVGGFMGRRGGAALRIKRWLLDHERGR